MVRTCSIQDCNRKHKGRGYCNTHYERFRNHGSPYIVLKAGVKPGSTHNHALKGADNPRWVGDKVTYASMHIRIARKRGSASLWPCVDCGEQADDWSLGKFDDVLLCPKTGMAYSTDIGNYVSRCKSCHKQYDLQVRA